MLGDIKLLFAGVYFEKMLKTKDASSIWIKNLQMYIWSVPFTLLAVVVEDWDKVAEKGFFYDYNYVVFAIIGKKSFVIVTMDYMPKGITCLRCLSP